MRKLTTLISTWLDREIGKLRCQMDPKYDTRLEVETNG